VPKYVVADPRELDAATLANLVTFVQEVLWLEPATVSYWSTDKVWVPELLEVTAREFYRMGLGPKPVEDKEPTRFHVVMRVWEVDAAGRFLQSSETKGVFSAMSAADAVECAEDAWLDPKLEAEGCTFEFSVRKLIAPTRKEP
jgi:hypothetical protein